jgi:hypothetical protein
VADTARDHSTILGPTVGAIALGNLIAVRANRRHIDRRKLCHKVFPVLEYPGLLRFGRPIALKNVPQLPGVVLAAESNERWRMVSKAVDAFWKCQPTLLPVEHEEWSLYELLHMRGHETEPRLFRELLLACLSQSSVRTEGHVLHHQLISDTRSSR